MGTDCVCFLYSKQGVGERASDVPVGSSGKKSAAAGGARSAAAGDTGGGDGGSVVSRKGGSQLASNKVNRVVHATDASDQTFKLERGLFKSRSYVFTHLSDFQQLEERFLNDGVFACAAPLDAASASLAHTSGHAGLPTVAMDAFVVLSDEEPTRDMAQLSVLVHARTCLQLKSSHVPRSLDVVTAVEGVPQTKSEKNVKSVLRSGISGKPGQHIGV